MGPKYEFTDETMIYRGRLLHRIRRLSNGKLGGWIEKEENLSQEGNCWVWDEAKVFCNAKVYDDAQVTHHAEVHNNAMVYGTAYVRDNAEVYNDAMVYGKAYVGNTAQVYDSAKVYDNALVNGNAKVYHKACVCDKAEVSDEAWISGNAKVYDKACVYENAWVGDYAQVYGHAKISGNAKIGHNTKIYLDAMIYGMARIGDFAEVYDEARVYGNALVCGKAYVGGTAEVYGNAIINDKCINSGEYSSISDYKEDSSKEVVQDFIYKVDDSNKITTQTEYDSVDEFFSEPITNDIKLDTLVICAIDTKEPLIKLQKIETDNKTEFKFIVDITNEDGDNFTFKSIIKSQEQLDQLIQQTIDALKLYAKFSKYIDDLESCI